MPLSNPTTPERDLLAVTYDKVKEIRVVDTDDQSKVLAIKNLAIAGTKVTVAVDGLSGTLDGAFEDVLTKIAGKADTAQVEALDAEKLDIANVYNALDKTAEGFALDARQGKTLDGAMVHKTGNESIAGIKTFSSSPIVPTPTTNMQASTKKYVDDGDVVLEADQKAVHPEIAYNKRVVADGGTIHKKRETNELHQQALDILSSAKFMWDGHAGTKRRVSGANTFATKIYSMDGADNDGVQTVEANQPYLGGLIADGESAKIKYMGESGKPLIIPEISYLATDEWCIVCIATGDTGACLLSSGIVLNNAAFQLTSLSTGSLIKPAVDQYDASGITHIAIYNYNNGAGSLFVDGVYIPSVVNSGVLIINEIFQNLPGYRTTTSIFHISLFDTALSASQISVLHAYLRSIHPPIETTHVGSQQIATSNLEATVFGGVKIPEVQDDSAWAALTTPAWSYYNNDPAIGAIYGKLYNGYATDIINAAEIVGYHVPSELEWTQLSESLGGNTVSGGKLKAKYGGFDNQFATNESGVSLLPSGARSTSGPFALFGQYGVQRSTSSHVSVDRTNVFTFAGAALQNAGYSLRLFSNTPYLTTNLYESGWFATNIASTPKSIRIPFGTKVTNIKCVTTTNVTSIEAKLFSYGGTELETLITGKACNATTKSFTVVADQTVSYTDNYVRVTGAGNSGTGMNIIVTIEMI